MIIAFILIAIAVAMVAIYLILPRLLEPAYGPRVNADGDYVFDEQILEEIDVMSASEVQSVADLTEGLAQRGFENCLISAPYTLDGALTEGEYLDGSSGEKYPLYVVEYVTKSGNYWSILVCDGSYMANPVFLYDYSGPQVILVEDDYVMAYDSDAGKFYRTIPAERELDVKKVDRVDAETLESLGAKEVEAL